MDDISKMIRNMLDMECEHIRKGFITKEFAGQAIDAFIQSLKVVCDGEESVMLSKILDYLSKWSKLYIENVGIEESK